MSKPPFQTNSSPEIVSKLDLTDAKNSDTAHIKSIEITSILNGLQGKYNKYPLCMQVFVVSFYKSNSVKVIHWHQIVFLMEPEFFLVLLLEMKPVIDWGLEIFLLIDPRAPLNYS